MELLIGEVQLGNVVKRRLQDVEQFALINKPVTIDIVDTERNYSS